MWNPLNFFSNRKSQGHSDQTNNITAMESETPVIENSGDIIQSENPWDDHQEFLGGEPPLEAGVVARSGDALERGTKIADKEAIIEALKTVYDPEIPVDIYELGLIYEINTELDGNVRLTMTLTAPGCPVAGILPQQVADAAAGVAGVGEVEVTLVWDPPWDMEKMSDDAKLALDAF